jgi:carbonic anhydrase/acetyltransferase-like protein (isoleucine patch superfamily)
MILPYNGIYPKIDESVLICEGVQIIGDVEIGKESSIWFNTVIRGDVNYIRIGERTNVQDLSMLHVTYKKYPLIIGNDVTIGHSVTLHGCTVKDFVLIGMGAILLDNCVINSNSLIAAGALVKEKFIVPEGVLVAGVPGKIVRDLTLQEIEKVKRGAKNYLMYVETYRNKK